MVGVFEKGEQLIINGVFKQIFFSISFISLYAFRNIKKLQTMLT